MVLRVKFMSCILGWMDLLNNIRVEYCGLDELSSMFSNGGLLILWNCGLFGVILIREISIWCGSNQLGACV